MVPWVVTHAHRIMRGNIMHRRTLATSLLALAMVGFGSGAALAQSPDASPSHVTAADARAWCEAKGGTVQERHAYFGTNDDQSEWVDLGRSMELCRFQADDEAKSRIYVDVTTLATPTPTLASAAYLAKVQNELVPAKGITATQNCTALGGTSVFGPGASGGGWVALDDPDDGVIALCLFADGSAIEEWGITYYAAGTVRGADLAPLFGWSGDRGSRIFQ
jgi:putative hemolysin